ncbi:MAG: hypothetical protein MUP47_08825, partial [Phycisphaerae bacterium]|nr:hypothetical protein [Phycisphaerae bacterium]
AYNFVRFGSPLQTGYGPAHTAMGQGITLFSTPWVDGLGGLLLSPGKSVFLYNPVLLLAILGLAAFWKAHRGLAMMVIAAFAATVLFHSKFTFWSGDLAWGPRYLASVMGLCVLPIVPLVQRARWRWLVAPAVGVSVVIQLASVVHSFGLEYFQDRRHGTIPDGYVWRAGESQLFCRFRNIALDLVGRPDFSSRPPQRIRPETHQVLTTPEQVKAVHWVALFPFKARAATGNVRLFRALFALWVVMLFIEMRLTLVWWRRMKLFKAGAGPGPCAPAAGGPQSPTRLT